MELVQQKLLKAFKQHKSISRLKFLFTDNEKNFIVVKGETFTKFCKRVHGM